MFSGCLIAKFLFWWNLSNLVGNTCFALSVRIYILQVNVLKITFCFLSRETLRVVIEWNPNNPIDRRVSVLFGLYTSSIGLWCETTSIYTTKCGTRAVMIAKISLFFEQATRRNQETLHPCIWLVSVQRFTIDKATAFERRSRDHTCETVFRRRLSLLPEIPNGIPTQFVFGNPVREKLTYIPFLCWLKKGSLSFQRKTAMAMELRLEYEKETESEICTILYVQFGLVATVLKMFTCA